MNDDLTEKILLLIFLIQKTKKKEKKTKNNLLTIQNTCKCKCFFFFSFVSNFLATKWNQFFINLIIVRPLYRKEKIKMTKHNWNNNELSVVKTHQFILNLESMHNIWFKRKKKKQIIVLFINDFIVIKQLLKWTRHFHFFLLNVCRFSQCLSFYFFYFIFFCFVSFPPLNHPTRRHINSPSFKLFQKCRD